MKTQLDIVVTSGLWLRLLGGACTEMVKHYATKNCSERLGIWAWDKDPRGIDWLVPEPMYAAPACHDAELRAREFADLGDYSVDALAKSVERTLGGGGRKDPVLALATLTSKSTFAETLDVLARVERDILLVAIADFPQDPSLLRELPVRVDAGQERLRHAITANPRLAGVVLSRGAFTGNAETMGDTPKQFFTSCVQHLLWLILTHDEPAGLVRAWHRKMLREPTAGWTLGHLQLDCGKSSGRESPVRGHTWLGGEKPCRRDAEPNTLRVTDYNHLGFREDTGKCQVVTADVFREPGKSPRVEVAGVDLTEHDTWLVERIDIVLLNKVETHHS